MNTKTSNEINVKKVKKIRKKSSTSDKIKIAILSVVSLIVLAPIFLVVMNAFKGKLYVSDNPFALPNSESFVGFKNFIEGAQKIDFLHAFGVTLWITVVSVVVIVLCTSMLSWFIVRVDAWYSKVLYILCAFSMIVPFQMVMFPVTIVADHLNMENMLGMVILYLGFGAGLSVFIFTGFLKSVPLALEEAAMIDGCGPLRTFFLIVFPVLKPTAITIAILNAMWIWNDYLLPSLILPGEQRTISVAVQYLKGGYGSIDMAQMMAMLVLAIIPIITFFLLAQKHIIKGVVAGSVKG